MVKNKWIRSFLAIITLLTINLTTFAASTTWNWKPSANDESILLLQQIFGPMHGILGLGKDDPMGIFGHLFKTFNTAMLSLAVIVIIYTVVLSIVNTAHQGEFMGRKLDSVWVPLRSILGILLIFPTNVGYSLIQLVMMWVVVLGIGAADSVWTTAVQYIGNPKVAGGIAVMMPDEAPYVEIANGLLKSAICLYKNYREWGNATSSSSALTSKNIKSYFTALSSSLGSLDGYNFNCWYPNTPSTKTTLPVCTLDAPSGEKTSQQNCGQAEWPESDPKLDKVYKAQITTMLDNGLLAMAKDYVFTNVLPPYNVNPIDYENSANKKVGLAIDFRDAIAKYQAKDGANLVLTKFSKETGGVGYDPSHPEQFFEQNAKQGWIMAGALYYQLAQISDEINQIGTIADLQFVDGSDTNYDSANIAVNDWTQQGQGNSLNTMGSVKGFSTGFDILLKPILMGFLWVITGSSTNSDFINSGFSADTVNPLIAIQMLGQRIVHTAEVVWMITLGVMLISAMIAGLCRSVSPFATIFSVISRFIFLPLMFGVGLLFVSGITMQVYIPMIPFIIFTFATIGWLIGVLESILAAPLVALGISHPEGHEVMGRAAPSIMLLVTVFIRPTFMLFGLIGGMLISIAGVMLLNLTFKLVTGIVGAEFGEVQMIFMLTVYVSIVIAILNKSYGLIASLPDDVLRFIGNQAQLGGMDSSQSPQETKQAFGGAAGGGERAFSQMESGAKSEAEHAHGRQEKLGDEKAAEKQAEAGQAPTAENANKDSSSTPERGGGEGGGAQGSGGGGGGHPGGGGHLGGADDTSTGTGVGGDK